LLVGLTGGLACGKSTVLSLFASLGAATIDADRLARGALAPSSPLLGRVRDLLGDGVFDAAGAIDRARVAAKVFADPGLRLGLEALVHPEVILKEDEAIAAHTRNGAAMVVCDAALLFEAGRAPRFDRLVVVACPAALQEERAVARGMARGDARARITAQMPVADKTRLADYVIDSSGTPEETERQAREVFARLEADAGRAGGGWPPLSP